jgi:hypothetical protein
MNVISMHICRRYLQISVYVCLSSSLACTSAASESHELRLLARLNRAGARTTTPTLCFCCVLILSSFALALKRGFNAVIEVC